ncbi:MAG: hypothetical protein Q6373_017905 [Candidatus Sigynarchaeota archaeon]
MDCFKTSAVKIKREPGQRARCRPLVPRERARNSPVRCCAKASILTASDPPRDRSTTGQGAMAMRAVA